MSKLFAWSRFAVVVCAMVGFTLPVHARDGANAKQKRSDKDKIPPTVVGLFEGMESGEIEVKFVPANAERATVVLKNKSGKPLQVRLPEAFAGVPVQAQFGGGGFGGGGLGGGGLGGGGFGGGGFGGGGGQGLGGGFGGGGFGGGGLGGGGFGGGLGGGGFGGGLMNLSPDRVRRLKVTTVCLEHGKKDPNPRMKYTIVPIEKFTKKKEVAELCKLLGTGRINRDAAQAAAWHFTDNMSWRELANKVGVVHLNGMREPFFSPQEIAVGMRLASYCRQRVEMMEKRERSLSEGGSLSQER